MNDEKLIAQINAAMEYQKKIDELQALRAKDAERIADLEEALKENMYSNSTDIALKLGTEALANKSDWPAKHDAEIRRKVLLEAAELFDCGFSHLYSGYAEDVLRRMANAIEVTK